MLTEARNTFNFVIKSLICNIKSSMEYKKSFILQTVFMMINNGFFLIFWLVVFGINNGNISGITMDDILYLWSIPVISWGAAHFFFGGITEINRYIINGELDTYLLQPKNMFFNVATSRCDVGAFGDLVYGLILGVIVSNNILDFLQILMYSAIATIITIAITVSIRCLAIWFGDVENLAHVYEQSLFATLTNYPEAVFGKGIKFIMYTIVPAMYAVHLPIRLMGKFDIKIFLLIILATIIFVLIAKMLFSIVLKKYESGNNIALKS